MCFNIDNFCEPSAGATYSIVYIFYLPTVDCMKEKENYKKWQDLTEDWRQLLLKNCFKSFAIFMEAREIANPEEMDILKERLAEEQKKAGVQRKALMEQVLNFKPPTVSPAIVYEWREAADKLFEDLGA